MGSRQNNYRSTVLFVLGAVVFALLVSGCARHHVVEKPNYYRQLPPGVMGLEKLTDPSEYPDFALGYYNRDGLAEAIERSIDYLANHPSSEEFFPYLSISHEDAIRSLRAFHEIVTTAESAEILRSRIVSDFDVYRSVGADERHIVLFTGYCEPILDGSLTRTAQFKYPIYRLPPDLIKDKYGKCLGRRLASGATVPYYYTRKEIDIDGVLAGKGLELFYLKDPLDVYIAQVQGSAIIRLPDGTERRVGYAGKNGYPYTSVGRKLVQKKMLAKHELSLQGIRNYFQANSALLQECLNWNESYVFFRAAEDGPYGCINQKLTAYRSIATDKSIFPRACIAFADTRVPAEGIGKSIIERPFKSFMLDQDTGGAIRTPGRADIFMGTGDNAELLAGRTYAEGHLYYIFLKPSLVQGTGAAFTTEIE